MLKRCAFILFSACCWSSANADDTKPVPSTVVTVEAPASATPASEFFKPGGWSFNLYAGRYAVAEEPQFVGIRNKYVLGMGLSAGLIVTPIWAWTSNSFS